MSLERSALVVFGEDWGRHPSSTQHIVSRLAQNRDVIWVNSIGLRRPRLNWSDLGRVFNKLAKMTRGGNGTSASQASLPERLSIIAPRAISWPGSAFVETINRRLLTGQIRAEMERRKLSDVVLWTSLPSAVPLVGHLGERAVVYYCGDDFESLEGVDHEAVGGLERRLAAKADLIIACSPVLARKFPKQKTMLVPHGVDLGLFQSAAARPKDMPRSSKIVGFYGSLSAWIDIDAIALTARKLTDWSFVLIGPVRTDIRVLDGLPNVVLLG